MSAPATDPALLKLAQQNGLMDSWQDVYGHTHRVQPAVLQALLEALGLPCGSASQIRESQDLIDREASDRRSAMIFADIGSMPIFNYRGPMSYRVALEGGGHKTGMAVLAGSDRVSIGALNVAGYHTLEIGDKRIPLTIAPVRCPSVADLAGQTDARLWGVATQLYSLRRLQNDASGRESPHLTEAGDYTALAEFSRAAARRGADAVAISPVHAMFSADPSRYSPYAPSSRIFLNVNFADPEMVLGSDAVKVDDLPAGGFMQRQGERLIDWPKVLHYRMWAFRQAFERFGSGAPRHLVQALADFRRRGGEMLQHHGCYEALHAHFATVLGPSCGWQDWPAELQDASSKAVRQFAAEHAREVDFHVFLQWLADEGLRMAQQCARQEGMTIGTIIDLAIGTDPRGSHVWSSRGDFVGNVSIGAPPDLYQPKGQDWGLAAFSPRAMINQDYAPFIEILRAALPYGGGVRIDHILGLARMWLIPRGAAAADGCYVRYPLENMLRILALEASRHQAIVIGENLGTVPPDFNDRIYEKNLLGTSVLWFERAGAGQDSEAEFTPSKTWSPHAIATTSTHDLPTVAGWWAGRDLQWRRQLEQITPDEFAKQELDRKREKKALWRAVHNAGEDGLHACATLPQSMREDILSFVASTPSPLALIPIEDLLGESEQANLPGAPQTGAVGHPNWRRLQPCAAGAVLELEGAAECIAAVRHGRETP